MNGDKNRKRNVACFQSSQLFGPTTNKLRGVDAVQVALLG